MEARQTLPGLCFSAIIETSKNPGKGLIMPAVSYVIVVFVLIAISIVALVTGVRFECPHPEQDDLEEHRRMMERREVQ